MSPHDDEMGKGPAGVNGETLNSAKHGRRDQIAAHRAHLEPLFRAGYELIPLNHPDASDKRGRNVGKAPAKAKWRTLPALSLDDAVGHLAAGSNVGVRLRDTDLVVDVDPRHFAEGDDPLARLLADFGLPECPAVVTGGGGFHLYLRKPADLSVRGSLEKYPGIEFKTHGRQVVAPGSIHPDTRKRYSVDPMALVALTDAPEAPPGFLGALDVPSIASNTEAGLVSPEELELLLSALDPSAFPDNGSWQPILFACHHATAGAGRDEFIAWSLSSAGAGSEWEIGNRWDSLHADNQGKRVTTRTLLDAIGEEAEGAAGELRRVLYAQLDFAELDVELPEVDADWDWREALGMVPALDEPELEAPGQPQRSRFLSIDEVMQQPDPTWLVKGLIPKGGVGLLIGQSQAYKSFLALRIALGASAGVHPHPDHPVMEAFETVYIAGEGAGGFKLRIKAWMNAHPEAKPTLRLQTRPTYLDSEQQARELAQAVRDLAKQDGPGHRLLVVDTLSANFTGKENTDDLAAFLRHCQSIARACDVTVLVVHHLGKDGDRGPRGHSSLTGNTDFWMTLTRPNMEKRVVQLKPHKLKDAPTDHELWFEAVSVPVADCGEFTDSLVLQACSPQAPGPKPAKGRPRASADADFNGVEKMLALVADGDSVPDFIASVGTALGVAEATARRRVMEALVGSGITIEKLEHEKNRRVFRVASE